MRFRHCAALGRNDTCRYLSRARLAELTGYPDFTGYKILLLFDMHGYTHQNSSATQKVMTRSGQISGSLRMVANSCSPKNKGRDNDTLFMLIPETMETFWLLSLKYHPAIFFEPPRRQGREEGQGDSHHWVEKPMAGKQSHIVEKQLMVFTFAPLPSCSS